MLLYQNKGTATYWCTRLTSGTWTLFLCKYFLYSSIRSNEGLTLETSAFRIPVRWPIYITNSVDKTKFMCGLSLLLVLFSSPRGFSLGTPVSPSPQKATLLNSNSRATGLSVVKITPLWKKVAFFVTIFVPLFLIPLKRRNKTKNKTNKGCKGFITNLPL